MRVERLYVGKTRRGADGGVGSDRLTVVVVTGGPKENMDAGNRGGRFHGHGRQRGCCRRLCGATRPGNVDDHRIVMVLQYVLEYTICVIPFISRSLIIVDQDLKRG
jgi:hypothetical protein